MASVFAYVRNSAWGRCLNADDLAHAAAAARSVVVAAGADVVHGGEKAAFWVGLAHCSCFSPRG